MPFILLFNECDGAPSLLGEERGNLHFNFRACDFGVLNDIFGDTDWNTLMDEAEVDGMLAAFYGKLNDVFEEFVPKQRHDSSSVFCKPWWTPELRNLRNTLRKARNRFFLSKSDPDRALLQEMETTYKALLLSTYENYISFVESSVKQNPSRFWEFAKKLNTKNRVPPHVSYNGIISRDNSEAATLFASFFENVFSRVSPVQRHDIFAHLQSYDIQLPVLQLSPEEVMDALLDIDSKKGPGPDEIPPLVFKNCAATLSAPIAIIFNRSFRDRIFPATWKEAYIVPIHKSGNCNIVSNYRGISILCCLSKVLEKLFYKAVDNIVAPIISESQHGFRKKRSTTTNLMCFVTTLFREVEAGNQVDSVYIDFAKAFDTVPHNLIIEKMRHLGFPAWITEWLHSYLVDRHAFVLVNSTRSHTFEITSGVPQGSVLGPLIFNIFINDLYSLLSSFNLSFADDFKFYRVISSLVDCAAIQQDIDTMLVWCDNNGMRVNSDKCKVISFSRRNNTHHHQYSIGSNSLNRVNSICDLGVTVDAKVRFNDHIGIVTAKAFSVLGMIRRHASDFTDVYALKTLYCSLVRSVLEYASPVWSPYHVTQILTIERVQKKFLRFALRQLPWNDPSILPPYSDRCQLINLESLSSRRLKQQRLLIFDIIKGTIDCPALLEQIRFNVPSRRLRNSVLLAIPYHRTNYGLNSSFTSCLRVFNQVIDKFDFNVSKDVFSNRIKDYN